MSESFLQIKSVVKWFLIMSNLCTVSFSYQFQHFSCWSKTHRKPWPDHPTATHPTGAAILFFHETTFDPPRKCIHIKIGPNLKRSSMTEFKHWFLYITLCITHICTCRSLVCLDGRTRMLTDAWNWCWDQYWELYVDARTFTTLKTTNNVVCKQTFITRSTEWKEAADMSVL